MAEVRDEGGPAFPNKFGMAGKRTVGMSLRDYFAAHALPALIQKNTDCKGCSDGTTCSVLQMNIAGAYDYADAMLAERKK